MDEPKPTPVELIQRDLRNLLVVYNNRLDEIEALQTALTAENNDLVHRVNNIETTLAGLDELYGDKEE